MVDCLPQKEEPNRAILTVWGDLIEYPGDVRTPTSDTTTANIVWNISVSTPKSKYMCIGNNNFYLGAPLTRYEYLHISITLIPEDIIHKYNLLPFVRNGFIYLDICKGMYGFP